MAKAIAGFFRTRSEGEAARQALLDNGFNNDEINFLSGDTTEKQTPAIGPVESVGAESEAGSDAFLGGVAGMALGVISVLIPGTGLIFAAGPRAAALGGIAVGATAGGIIGMIRDQGFSQEEAEFIAEGVKRGGALVTVHGVSEDRADKAREILKDQNAIDVEKLAEEPAR